MKVTEFVRMILEGKKIIYSQRKTLEKQFKKWRESDVRFEPLPDNALSFIAYLQEQVEKEKISDEKKRLDKQK